MTAFTPRILLVDDDTLLLTAYARALQRFAPLTAEDGIAARKILVETEIDIVVCDLDMPRMNGIELMTWAKEHCPRPLWIVSTGQGTFDAAVQALKLGAFDFISKPLQTILQLTIAVANAARQQGLVGERARLMRSLVDNNLKLEAANAVLREQQELLEQDMQRAERIVRALLPQSLTAIDKMQVNVSYRPSQSIGGDFYGATMLDAGHLAVYIADAAGHGVSAALLAVLFNQRLSLLKSRGLRAPAEILGELNRGLLEECRASGLFVTAVFALIDVEQRTATLASAGHPPSILLRCDGTSEHLEKTGPALGLAPDATYDERQLSLAEGDRLFLYTDGLTDAIPDTAPNLAAILGAVTAAVDDEANVIDHLLTWTERGERYDDDITILLVTAAPVKARPIAIPSKPDCALAVATEASTTWVAIRGRTSWKDAARLRDACLESLNAGQSLIIDLSSCIMLDSTMLGTLHEMVVRAATQGRLQLQNVDDKIRALFEELAMSQVIQTITPVARPTPTAMTELRPVDAPIAGSLILRAHELLAGLSPSNAEQFQPVVDSLREAEES